MGAWPVVIFEMCGINGIFAYNVAADAPAREELLATRDHMTRRGPDGCGEFWSDDRRLGLGHRRLSIVDLTDRAAQPMASATGRYTVVFNGEIYNYPELKRELEAAGVRFASSSDTEILLHLYEREGAQMVQQLRGMFAFAIWDRDLRSLFLARDPYGIKPLYIADDGWTVRFASQVKALLAGGRISRDPEPAGLVGFHLWGSVPDPFTLYRDIRALPAGHTQIIDAGGPRPPEQFTSIADTFYTGGAQRPPGSAEVGSAFSDSVRAHLMADVEVGVFLSAGIDSGAVLGLMRDAGQDKITAITLQFDEFLGTPDDETGGAKALARRYGARHVVRTVGEAEFQQDLPMILEAMDQPTIDGINTWFIAKAAREAGLKVAMSGLGGDELLAGYPSFHDMPRWRALARWPAAIPGLGKAFRYAAHGFSLDRTNPKLAGLVEYGGTWPGVYFLRRALLLPFELGTVLDGETVATGLERLRLIPQIAAIDCATQVTPISRVAALESSFYLRNQLLRDADWAGMAHSIEIRTPLVDIELLRRLSPLTARIKGRSGKMALAAAPSQALPSGLVGNAKTGFSVPARQWLTANRSTPPSTRGLASRDWARQVIARWS